MKKMLLLLLLSGCVSNKYVDVSARSVKSTVSISVKTVVEEFLIGFNDGKLNVERSTVPVNVTGSGVFISQYGHILTCAHLFTVGERQATEVTLSWGLQGIPAQVLYMDEDKDLALIKIPTTPLCQYHPAKLTEAFLSVGQEVIAVGSPLRLPFSVTHGIISYLDRSLDEPFTFTQIDTPINPGNSGGPLFNLSGELVGINARKMQSADGLGFAISPSTIQEFLDVFKGVSND